MGILFTEPVKAGGGLTLEPALKPATPVVATPTSIQLGWRGVLFITVGAGALAWGFWTLWPTLQRSFGS